MYQQDLFDSSLQWTYHLQCVIQIAHTIARLSAIREAGMDKTGGHLRPA